MRVDSEPQSALSKPQPIVFPSRKIPALACSALLLLKDCGTPLLSADRCYTFGAEGKLFCLELSTGKLIWQRDTAKDWEVPPAFFGVGSSPILESERVIVMVGGQPNAGVVGFDAKSGRTVW